MAETRAQERARGYRRPFERAGYPTEYAYRTREARGPEERARAGGKRGPSELDRLVRSGVVISADIGPGRDDDHASVRVLTTDGRIRRYDVKGGRRLGKNIDRMVDADVEVRRYPEKRK